MTDEPRDPKTGELIPPLGAIMIDQRTVQTRDGVKDFPDTLQIVENERGQRTGHERPNHKRDSKYRDVRLKQGSVRDIRNADGTVTTVAEYEPTE